MSAIDERAVADLLLEAAETHHRVYRITDGDDPDWASWYADWLVHHSELPELLHRTPVRSELVYLLVLLAKEVEDQPPSRAVGAVLRPAPGRTLRRGVAA